MCRWSSRMSEPVVVCVSGVHLWSHCQLCNLSRNPGVTLPGPTQQSDSTFFYSTSSIPMKPVIPEILWHPCLQLFACNHWRCCLCWSSSCWFGQDLDWSSSDVELASPVCSLVWVCRCFENSAGFRGQECAPSKSLWFARAYSCPPQWSSARPYHWIIRTAGQLTEASLSKISEISESCY